MLYDNVRFFEISVDTQFSLGMTNNKQTTDLKLPCVRKNNELDIIINWYCHFLSYMHIKEFAKHLFDMQTLSGMKTYR